MYGFDPAQLRSLTPKRVWNIGRLTASYGLSCLTKKLRLSAYPAVLSIEPTSYCNLKCPQCPTGLGTLRRPQGYMDFDLYRSIVDAAADYVMHIQFFFQGEPFMHKRLPDMIRYAKDRNIYTLTSTNGHFLTQRTIDRVFDSGLDALVLGLDGVTPDVYLNYRKNGHYDKVVTGIKELLAERKERELKHPRVYLQFIVMKQNEDQVGAVRDFGREIGVDKVLIKSAQIYPDMDPEEYLPEDDRFSRYTYENDELKLNVPVPNRCKKVFSTAVLTWDGQLASCCFDKDAEHSFGTWNGGAFLDLWRSERGMKFRQQILDDRSRIPMCSNCTEGIRIFR